jgi:hypothetical protein
MKISRQRPASAAGSVPPPSLASQAAPSRGATVAAARHILGMLAAELAYAGLFLSCCQTEALCAAIELECEDLAALDAARGLAS